jgi:hypothetical protein
MSRPTKLTPEVHKAVVDALEIGATRVDAAGAAGIDYTTFLNWMERGEKDGKGIFFKFFKASALAEYRARLKYLKVIQKAADDGDWRAALEYLKRRDRQNWGDVVDVTTGGEKIVINLKSEDGD